MLEITLRKGWITSSPNQRENLKGLGLMRRERKVYREDSSATRGMIMKVIHLVDVRKVESKPAPAEAVKWVDITPPEEPAAAAPEKTKPAGPKAKKAEPAKAAPKKKLR